MWDSNNEKECLRLRDAGMTYAKLAETFNTSVSSVKHKIRRLQQSDNQDRYKHTEEKKAILNELGINFKEKKILETHCGYGGLTEFYGASGKVTACDIVGDRVDHVRSLNNDNIQAIKCDSERQIIRMLADNTVFDIVDIDPYGFPSKFFPFVFGLIDSGYLFLTFPMMGVAQINKITIRHYEAFWGISLSDKDSYIEKIKKRMQDYAFMQKRDIEFLRIDRIERIYRFSIKVTKKSCLDIVGLKVNRRKK